MWTGEIAALTGALLWAIASVLYARVGVRIPALLLNLLKGAIAIALLGLTLWLGRVAIPPREGAWGLLALSGVIGIGLGDTAYLAALTALGARQALLLETLAPPIATLLAWIFLRETLSWVAIGGILLTLLGVAWVITERTEAAAIAPQLWQRGVVWGVLAELAQGSGVVLSRAALTDTTMTPLWSSLIRLVGGEIILLGLLITQGRSIFKSTLTWSYKSAGAIAIAAFGGTYLGIWLQQIALKRSPAGIAQTLLATSPLFVLPIVALLGEKITLRAAVGVGIAIAGIALLFNT